MKKVLLVAVSVLLVCTSCVTKKKYLLAENGRLEAIARGDDLQNQLVNCRDNNDGLTSRLASLERDTTRMGKNIRNYQSMLNTNMTEQEKLNSLLSQKMNELDERERTINELQDMINAQTERVQNLLNSVKDALLGFSSDELTVREKDGKVYVAMSDKLLFESGSARVDKRGKEALAKLAEVLNKQSDIDVYIEGHTDSKPINTAQFKDNWDLSVIRATSVVRILTKDYDVKPLQIQPCGRGEFMPVADNETADGRAKNRRTEIIMAPKFDEGALEVLSAKKNLRLLEVSMDKGDVDPKQYVSVNGGLLVQDLDVATKAVTADMCVTKAKPAAEQMEDLNFGWHIVKHVKSNAIVAVKDGRTLGVGAGQMNRIGSAEIALKQAHAAGVTEGLVLASDGFFPFDDCVTLAPEYGVTAIVQPGGSVRDEDSIRKADEKGIAMVFTGERHFKH